jgi:hypothetical protein
MIAAVREATFGVLPPIAVMMSIIGTFYLIGVAVLDRLSNEMAITSPRRLGAETPGVTVTVTWTVASPGQPGECRPGSVAQ